ncbi:hypothetical protein HPP92_020509 [Vanilla planifolia]|uniref:Uncharacterized protein n=1 Tax=Vanilla planifolia TaxID=51239 RepID=A0A835UKV5_VANPL|nr:hypothetical protein HPP92_020509 [Vanilla planifolia]
MGRIEKAGDAMNLLNFAGPRSLAELRGARADGIKNIDSISSLSPEARALEGSRASRGAEPQNGAMLVASNNIKEENEVNLHSRKDAHKGKHSRRDAHKENFEIYDWIGDAVNLLNFTGPRSLAELRGARADGIKNIDSISSLEPESKKRLKEAELPSYDVSVSFEGLKTLSVLKRKRGAEPKNGAMLVASNNIKEENDVNLHSRKDAHKGKHSRRDAHKGKHSGGCTQRKFQIYDWIGVDLPKVEYVFEEEALNHADGDRITHGQTCHWR